MLRQGSRLINYSVTARWSNKLLLNVPKKKSLVWASAQIVRNAGFFNTNSADSLWKGVTSVSNAGRKRGRGKGTDRKLKLDLNEGKIIGVGKEGVGWPGLSKPVIGPGKFIDFTMGDKIDVEPQMKRTGEKKKVKFHKSHPLEKGWTGKQPGGKKIGNPDPFEGRTFKNFESVVIECRAIMRMTGVFGKRRFVSSLVLTGNGEGLIGYGKAKTLDGKTSITNAKNKAIKRLISIDLIDKDTVNHDFITQYGKTKIFVFKRPKNHGLECQRVIKECCKLIGIKDIYCKLEGPSNYKNIVKAFILGLLNQKTYQDIADETKLHLVELTKERNNYPVVLASPKECLSEEEFQKNQVDFDEYIMGNRRILKKPSKGYFYQRLPSWQTHLKRTLFKRNENEVKIELLSRYGELRSHLADVYPECRKSVTGITKP